MIANLSSDFEDVLESLSTCRFAQRVALVKNSAVVNEVVDPGILIQKQKSEIEELKNEIETNRIFLPPANLHPLNLVDFIEHNYPYFFTLSSPDDFYHLSSYKSKNNIKFSPLEFPKLPELSKIMFDNINITSTAVHDDFLFAGDDKGVVYMFSCETQREVKCFKMNDINEKIPKAGIIVSAIDVSKDGNYLIAGYANGFIALWNIPDRKFIFSIVDINRMHFGTITQKQACCSFSRLWGPKEFIVSIVSEYAQLAGYDISSSMNICLEERRRFWTRYQRKREIEFNLEL